MKKLIEGSKNYFVDTQGNVFGISGKILKADISNVGYKRVAIRMIDGSVKRFSVHRLVAMTFIPNPENKKCVNHLDGDKLNNALHNLEWATTSENMIHARDTNLISVGEDTYNSVYSEQQIDACCRMFEEGYRNCDICKILGLPKNIVSQVRNGVIWVHVSSRYNIKRVRQKRVSIETVEWVCRMLEQELSVLDIFSMATNQEITKALIYDIKARRVYSKITRNFNF